MNLIATIFTIVATTTPVSPASFSSNTTTPAASADVNKFFPNQQNEQESAKKESQESKFFIFTILTKINQREVSSNFLGTSNFDCRQFCSPLRYDDELYLN